MLFGKSFHQSQSNQSAAADQTIFSRLQLHGVQSATLDRTALGGLPLDGIDCRGLHGDIDGLLIGSTHFHCPSAGEVSNESANVVAVDINLTVACKNQRSADRQDERCLDNKPYPATEELKPKSGKLFSNYASVNARIETVKVSAATTISAPENSNQNLHLVPFIHNRNRLTCRWKSPSI